MSDTPRTDYEIEVNQLDRFEADWPRKLERECDRLAKQCVKNVEEIGQLRAELREAKSINLELVPNEWALEHFKSICDIKMPEAAMISGDQLLELLTDAKRFAWLLEFATRGASYIQCMGFRVNNRESIDKAMEATNHE